jgi:hypothetical protein
MTIEVDDPGASVPSLGAATDEARLKESVEHDLHVEFPSVPVDQVTMLVECLWSHFGTAPVRDFVPVLVRKQAKEELRDHLGPRAETVIPAIGTAAPHTHNQDPRRPRATLHEAPIWRRLLVLPRLRAR